MTRLELLRKLFADKEWNVNELADRSGLSRGAVSRHLNGKVDPDFATWKKYAQAFSMDIDRFDQLRKMPIEAGGEVAVTEEAEGDAPTIIVTGDDGRSVTLDRAIAKEIKRRADAVGLDVLEWMLETLRQQQEQQSKGGDTGPAATGGQPQDAPLPPKRPRNQK